MEKWRSYEEVATHLLDQCSSSFGLERVEGKQTLAGKETEWTIDAKGICQNGEGFVVVECRLYRHARQSQEKVGALAYRIRDLGAAGGILVSPLGLQKGAEKIASAENIIGVHLDRDSTTTDYVMSFLKQVMVGHSFKASAGMTQSAEVSRLCPECGRRYAVREGDLRVCPECHPAP